MTEWCGVCQHDAESLFQAVQVGYFSRTTHIFVFIPFISQDLLGISDLYLMSVKLVSSCHHFY